MSEAQWVSDDYTEAATYVPEVDAVRYSCVDGMEHKTVWLGRDELRAMLGLLPEEARDE